MHCSSRGTSPAVKHDEGGFVEEVTAELRLEKIGGISIRKRGLGRKVLACLGKKQSGPAQAMLRGHWTHPCWLQPGIFAVNRVPCASTREHEDNIPSLFSVYSLESLRLFSEITNTQSTLSIRRNSFLVLNSDRVDGLTEKTLDSKYTLCKFVFFLQEDRK